jgi:hypothetical protein
MTDRRLEELFVEEVFRERCVKARAGLGGLVHDDVRER